MDLLRHLSDMIESVLLIFNASGTWERIVRAERGLLGILFKFLLPLLLLTCAIEGYGLTHWGKHQVTASRPKIFTPGEAVVFEAGQLATSLLVVFIGAAVLKSMGGTFHARNTYQQAFTVVAYALSPFFLVRLLDAFTPISPWLTWGIGIFLALAALYHGVPQVMEPDPPQAFGLYLMTAVLMFSITGVMGFVAAWYLQGRFTKLEALISSAGARLPF
jgi:hypothetical protein